MSADTVQMGLDSSIEVVDIVEAVLLQVQVELRVDQVQAPAGYESSQEELPRTLALFLAVPAIGVF